MDEARSIAAQWADGAAQRDDWPYAAYLHAVAGRTSDARALLDRLGPELKAEEAWHRAVVHAVLGDRIETLEWLDYAAARGHKEPIGGAWDVEFSEFADSPRYPMLRDRMTLR